MSKKPSQDGRVGFRNWDVALKFLIECFHQVIEHLDIFVWYCFLQGTIEALSLVRVQDLWLVPS